MPRAYYNEFDKKAAAHLRNAIAAGLVLDGDVDDRDIRDVRPSELAGYDQHHFFAGIGIWSLALRWAGWPDDRPVWTGSCPCQPFSGAGKGLGFADERHVWPFWNWLIEKHRPDTIFGEQVSSSDGLAWFDLVSSDLEGAGYTVGAVDTCSASVGAPNIRQRLYWVADAHGGHASAEWQQRSGEQRLFAKGGGALLGLAHAESRGCGIDGILPETHGERQDAGQLAQRDEDAVRLGNATDVGRTGLAGQKISQRIAVANPWRELEWIASRDGKQRPTKPGLFPLAPRNPGDVGILRTAGNAINPYVAEAFIRSYLESCLI